MTTRTWISSVAVLAILCTAGCEKQETTPPDADASPPDADADDEPEPEEPEEPAEPEVTILTKASFDETIYDNMQAVSDCYLAALETNDKLEGKLDAMFTFGEDGVPTGVTAAEGSTLSDEGLVQCIADASKAWGFDPPSEAGMTLRYQFNLEPAE